MFLEPESHPVFSWKEMVEKNTKFFFDVMIWFIIQLKISSIFEVDVPVSGFELF